MLSNIILAAICFGILAAFDKILFGKADYKIIDDEQQDG